MNGNLPNFIIVGAAKSGTTSLWRYLDQHPDVFIPEIKEGRFFSQMPQNFKGGAAAEYMNDGPRELGDYMQLYECAACKVRGDISNDYFYYYKKTIEYINNVYEECGQISPKIIIILRNPVDRIFSMYHHIIRLGSDNLSFEDAFECSYERIERGYPWMFDLKGVGMSFSATKEYLDSFTNVKVCFLEEMDNPSFMYSLFEYVGVNHSVQIDCHPRFNENSYVQPKSFTLNTIVNSWMPTLSHKMNFLPSWLRRGGKNVLNYVRKVNAGENVFELSDEMRRHLVEFYKDDVLSLEQLLGRKLSHWVS